MVPNGAINSITEEALTETISAYGLPVAETLATYRTTRRDASPGDLMADIITDWFFRIPAIRLVEAHTQGSGRTHMYKFAWRSPQFDGQLGACHGLEIPFVFDTLDKGGMEAMLGDAPPQHIADTIHKAWVNFATTGDPGWPQFDMDRRTTMRFDTTSEIAENPRSAERALWEGLR